jgi:hypothetical protein
MSGFLRRSGHRGDVLKNKKPVPKGNGLIVVEDFTIIIYYFHLYAVYVLSNYQEKSRHIFRNILYSLEAIKGTIHYRLKKSILVKIAGCYWKLLILCLTRQKKGVFLRPI